MRPFKFVHTADLHLDSPFVGIGQINETVGDELREATIHTFENIVDTCIKEKVDFLLVAGDVYDAQDRSLRAQLCFRDGVRRLSEAGIWSFVVHGNHDPLNGWSAKLEWPERLKIFGGRKVERVPVERGGEQIAQVYGISYPVPEVRQNLAKEFQRLDSGGFSIGLLHCNLGDNTGHAPYAPCTEKDLIESRMDYWALGHVHTRRVSPGGKPIIAYPGSPQGCSVQEPGERGCYLVEVEANGRPIVNFIAVDTIRWFWEQLTIDGIDDEDSLVAALESRCDAVRDAAGGRPAILRLTLKGRGMMHSRLSRHGFVDDLLTRAREGHMAVSPFVWLEEIRDETLPNVDLQTRRQGNDFLADLLNLVDEYKRDPALLDSLRDELRPLFQSRRGQVNLEMPGNEEILACLDKAETQCVDLLAEDDD